MLLAFVVKVHKKAWWKEQTATAEKMGLNEWKYWKGSIYGYFGNRNDVPFFSVVYSCAGR